MKKEETELEEGKHESKSLAAAFKKLKGKSTMSNKSSTGGTITRPAPVLQDMKLNSHLERSMEIVAKILKLQIKSRKI